MSLFLTRTKLTPPSPAPLSTLLYQNPSIGSLSSNIRSSFGLWPLLRMTLLVSTLIKLTPSLSSTLLYQTPSFARLRTSNSRWPPSGLLTTASLALCLRRPTLSFLASFGLSTLFVWVLVRCLNVGTFETFVSLSLSPSREAHPSSVFIQFLFLAGDLGRDQEQENQTNNLDLTERSCSNP